MAQRIQLKRSSINGKRPEGRYLEAGELALNTNGTNPGLFFEANDGSIVKVGPAVATSDGNPPLLSNTLAEYNEGELWFDSSDGSGTLMIYVEGAWVKAWNGASGGSTSGCVNGDILPCSSSQYDLGSDSQKWSNSYVDTVNSTTVNSTNVYTDNIYTGDLHMKNERGDWTAIEEETFLSLRNNKTGKRYKIMMEEIPEG